MWVKDNCIPAIVVNVGPGVYCFDNWSGTGKTYLSGLLKDLSVSEPVLAVSYNKQFTDVDYARFMLEDKLAVLLVDRYNLWRSNDLDDVLRFLASRGSIVLVDYKSPCHDKFFDFIVGVERVPGKVVVR